MSYSHCRISPGKCSNGSNVLFLLSYFRRDKGGCYNKFGCNDKGGFCSDIGSWDQR